MNDYKYYATLHRDQVPNAKTRGALRKEANDKAVEMAKMRYEQNMTYQEIGDKYGVTRQRVHAILCQFAKREAPSVNNK